MNVSLPQAPFLPAATADQAHGAVRSSGGGGKIKRRHSEKLKLLGYGGSNSKSSSNSKNPSSRKGGLQPTKSMVLGGKLQKYNSGSSSSSSSSSNSSNNSSNNNNDFETTRLGQLLGKFGMVPSRDNSFHAGQKSHENSFRTSINRRGASMMKLPTSLPLATVLDEDGSNHTTTTVEDLSSSSAHWCSGNNNEVFVQEVKPHTKARTSPKPSLDVIMENAKQKHVLRLRILDAMDKCDDILEKCHQAKHKIALLQSTDQYQFQFSDSDDFSDEFNSDDFASDDSCGYNDSSSEFSSTEFSLPKKKGTHNDEDDDDESTVEYNRGDNDESSVEDVESDFSLD